MATLHVQNVPEDLYAQLQQLAAAQNRSISAQIITILESALPTPAIQTQDKTRQNVAKILDDIRRRRERRPADLGLPDSTSLIREDRDR